LAANGAGQAQGLNADGSKKDIKLIRKKTTDSKPSREAMIEQGMSTQDAFVFLDSKKKSKGQNEE